MLWTSISILTFALSNSYFNELFTCFAKSACAFAVATSITPLSNLSIWLNKKCNNDLLFCGFIYFIALVRCKYSITFSNTK